MMIKEKKILRLNMLSVFSFILFLILFFQKVLVNTFCYDEFFTISFRNNSEYMCKIFIVSFATFLVFQGFLRGLKFNLNILIMAFALSISVFISSLLNELELNLFLPIALMITYIFLIDYSTKIVEKESLWTFAKLYFTLITILPLLIYFIIPEKSYNFFWTENYFKGFDSSRTTYSFCATIAVIIHLIERKKTWWLWSLTALIGVYLASNRTALFIIIFAAFFITFLDRRIILKSYTKLFLLLITSIPMIILMIFFIRVEDINDHSRRIQLLHTHINVWLDNFWFGLGGPNHLNYLIINDNIVDFRPTPAHNFLLESLVSFGIIATIIWLTLLWMFFKKLNDPGRILFVMTLFFGIFHNGFGLGVMNTFMFLCFLLCISTKDFFQNNLKYVSFHK